MSVTIRLLTRRTASMRPTPRRSVTAIAGPVLRNRAGAQETDMAARARPRRTPGVRGQNRAGTDRSPGASLPGFPACRLRQIVV